VRDTPPSIQDGKWGYEPKEVNHFVDSGAKGVRLSNADATRLGRQAYESSTNWLNAGRRAAWNNNLRAFQSLHPTGSKYISSGYTHRSTLYRPKTRAMVRRDEAATASAFFSNEDVVSIEPSDDDDPRQMASAELIKELLQFRLTKTIPWFLTVVGARQDCDVLGVCAGKVYWKYEEKHVGDQDRMKLDESGMIATHEDGTVRTYKEPLYQKIHDKPVIDLIPPENLRIDAGADWRDPVNTSPYIIELMPVYMHEARAKIESGEWNKVSESSLRNATDLDDDVTRRSREHGRVPGKDDEAWKPQDFAIVWTGVVIVKFGGQDWTYTAIASNWELLTDPKPLEEVHLHGQRPYVLGQVVCETHKTYPSGKVELIRDLQRATNDDLNLRFDNLKMNLNPRQFVRAGLAQDMRDLTTFIPGKTVIVNSKPGTAMNTDIVWDRPPEIGAQAFGEQDRLNLDFDEMTGSFSNSSVQASQITQQSATGMHLMSGEASGMTEYELRLFSETFVEPMLKLLIKLEQAYETDPVILALAGKRAQLATKYGIDGITDELLDQEVTVKVNVGIGATNPSMKLRNFLMASEAAAKFFGPMLAAGCNFEEVMKELYGLSGYKDGMRFIKPGFDPEQAMQNQAMAKQKPGQGPQIPDHTRVQAAQIQAQSKLEDTHLRNQNDQRSDQAAYELEKMKEQNENVRTQMKMQWEMQKEQAQMMQDHVHRQQDMQVQHQQRAEDRQMQMHDRAMDQVGQQMGNSQPPMHAMASLRDNAVSTFRNGQKWTRKQGKPQRVS
jgi:hypothetical protein